MTSWQRQSKGQEMAKVIRVHPEGNMNTCTRRHGGLCNTCWDILLKSKNISLIVALKENVMCSIRSERFIPRGTWMSVQHNSQQQTKVWSLDHSGGQNDISIPSTVSQAWLKIGKQHIFTIQPHNENWAINVNVQLIQSSEHKAAPVTSHGFITLHLILPSAICGEAVCSSEINEVFWSLCHAPAFSPIVIKFEWIKDWLRALFQFRPLFPPVVFIFLFKSCGDSSCTADQLWLLEGLCLRNREHLLFTLKYLWI